jgi:hypothetical protein
MAEAGKWSDAKKFYAETARTIVLGVLGALAANFILNRLADREKMQRDLRSQALAGFIEKSSNYTTQLSDFCLHNGRVDDNVFKSKTVDDYNLSMAVLELYFRKEPTVQKVIANARAQEQKVFPKCNNQKQDNGAIVWLPSSPDWGKERTQLIDDNKAIENAAEDLL